MNLKGIVMGAVCGVVAGTVLAAEPQYLVVDLEKPGAVTYVESLEKLPDGGLANDAYRTTRLVLRRIAAKGKGFLMGSPEWEIGHDCLADAGREGWNDGGVERRLPVRFTHDYYIGVYPVTQGQWERTMTGRCETYAGYATTPRPSWFTNEQYYASRPVENIPLRAIYGENTDMEAYPQFERILRPGRYLYVMRQLTGLRCDLPTDAQWEFACRAGTETSFYSGRNVCREVDSQSLGAICNRTAPAVDSADPALNLRNVTPAEGGTYTVGTCTPNAFGLYDLYGNVKEMVADWWCPTWPMHCHNQGLVIDPKGFADDWYTLYLAKVVSAAPTLRGGGFTDWGDQNTSCNSYRRYNGGDMYTGAYPEHGFRLIIQL